MGYVGSLTNPAMQSWAEEEELVNKREHPTFIMSKNTLSN
jgi:hypothetical protein